MTLHPEAIPAPLFLQHLTPLAQRLSDDEIVAYARAVALDLTDTDEPRIAEYHAQQGVMALLDHGGPRVMLSWPDGSLGPAWLVPGKPVTDCLIEAYRQGRECLEAIHFRNLPAAAGHH